jgi:hypothetical protein
MIFLLYHALWHSISVTSVMKKFLIGVLLVCIFFSCSKKTIPSKVLPPANDTVSSINNYPEAIIHDSVTVDSVAAPLAATVMVVADGYGRLITSQQSLPADAAVKYNSLQLSKGFTTQQRANLQARYKTVPPRVLYVPEQYSLNSLKGNYYIYKKKFWYWKKADGLFYLDEKYYL